MAHRPFHAICVLGKVNDRKDQTAPFPKSREPHWPRPKANSTEMSRRLACAPCVLATGREREEGEGKQQPLYETWPKRWCLSPRRFASALRSRCDTWAGTYPMAKADVLQIQSGTGACTGPDAIMRLGPNGSFVQLAEPWQRDIRALACMGV